MEELVSQSGYFASLCYFKFNSKINHIYDIISIINTALRYSDSVQEQNHAAIYLWQGGQLNH